MLHLSRKWNCAYSIFFWIEYRIWSQIQRNTYTTTHHGFCDCDVMYAFIIFSFDVVHDFSWTKMLLAVNGIYTAMNWTEIDGSVFLYTYKLVRPFGADLWTIYHNFKFTTFCFLVFIEFYARVFFFFRLQINLLSFVVCASIIKLKCVASTVIIIMKIWETFCSAQILCFIYSTQQRPISLLLLLFWLQ